MNVSTSVRPQLDRMRRLQPAYRLRRASSAADLRAAQTLRFLVFNVELQEGLAHSFATCLDADEFDPLCDHLLVEEVCTGAIVGTYRVQSGHQALSGRGYYSAREFQLEPFEPMRGQMLELGRACIHRDHRSFKVLSLLWHGIAAYAREHETRYLFGCSSLTSQDCSVGAATWQSLAGHVTPPSLRIEPVPAFACALAHVASKAPKVPKLLAAYLSLGAQVCGPPAIDRDFGTIDFLTLVDLKAPQQTRRLARFGIHI